MNIALTDKEKELLAWYQENGVSYFLKDFFRAGNLDFKLEIYPRNVQSGLWYSATWQSKAGRQRHVEAQWQTLLWERVIKTHLVQQREEE